MKKGDKVRFLNDVGGGIITDIRPGGIVMVKDADGFDIPMPQSEVIVIGTEKEKPEAGKKQAVTRMERQATPPQTEKPKEENLNGMEYLKSKTVTRNEDEDSSIDENLEARIVRLEMTIQKLETRIARLEAENNLRKNERSMKRATPPKPSKPTTLEDLQIL